MKVSAVFSIIGILNQMLIFVCLFVCFLLLWSINKENNLNIAICFLYQMKCATLGSIQKFSFQVMNCGHFNMLLMGVWNVFGFNRC